jgi:hypothetical protein
MDLGGCDETIKIWEDFDLFLRFAMAGKGHLYVPGIFSNYYRYLDVQSLARSNPQASALSRERVLRKTLETLARDNALTPPRGKSAARALFGVLRTAGIRDPGWLRAVNTKIRELDPDFKPCGSALYVAVANILGIVNAERMAVQLRHLRNQWC